MRVGGEVGEAGEGGRLGEKSYCVSPTRNDCKALVSSLKGYIKWLRDKSAQVELRKGAIVRPWKAATPRSEVMSS